MKRIAALLEQRAKLVAEAEAIYAAADKDGSRLLTADERAKDDGIKAQIKDLDAEVERLKAHADAVRSAPSAVAYNVTTTDSGSVVVSAPNATKDPRWGYRSHREFIADVMANSGASDRSQVTSERLKPLTVLDKDDKAAGGGPAFMLPRAFTPRTFMAVAGADEQGEYSDPHGGFSLVTSRLPGILEVGFEGDPTAGLTQSVPMQTPTVEIMARVDKDHTTSVSGGFTVARKAETVAAASSRGSFEMVVLKASSLFGAAYITEELITDSPASFVAIVDSGIRTQFGAHMLNEKLRGKGGNEYLGVHTALAASSLGPTISIAKESGQAAATIVYSNVIKMASRVWGFDNAVWIANHDTKPQLYVLAIPVGVGGTLIFQPSREVGFPDMLLGRPVYYSEFASTLGTQGDIGLYNWSQYLDGLYQPIQSAESIHVRFLNHERTFKLWLRNAGAPWWRTALTPNKSSSTLSPFVLLDTRS